jgi:hypothetical protein
MSITELSEKATIEPGTQVARVSRFLAPLSEPAVRRRPGTLGGDWH